MTNKSTNVGAFVGHCAGINTMKLRKQKQNKTSSFLGSYHRKMVASLVLIVLLILFVVLVLLLVILLVILLVLLLVGVLESILLDYCYSCEYVVIKEDETVELTI